jgi:hypothetical protein
MLILIIFLSHVAILYLQHYILQLEYHALVTKPIGLYKYIAYKVLENEKKSQ